MKKALSGFGIILMVFSGIGIFSLLGTLPGVFGKENAVLLLLSFLILAFIFIGLFSLGRRLNKRFGGSASQKVSGAAGVRPAVKTAGSGKSARLAAPKPLKQQKTAERAKQEPAKRQKPAEPAEQEAAKRRSGDGNMSSTSGNEVILYRDPDAEKTAQYRLEALHEIRACMPEGRPAICGKSFKYMEIGPGKDWLEEKTDIVEIPAEMLGRLTLESLREWLESCRKSWPVDWKDSTMRLRLSLWCWRISEMASRKVPDCVDSVPNPFGWLEHIGPDGLKDDSGIGLWLRMKENVTASEAIRALAATERKWKVAVVTENDSLLKEDTGLNADDLELCGRAGILFCLLTDSDSFRNLVDGKTYRVKTEEWPGSADDAATYGCWWLEELPLNPEG